MRANSWEQRHAFAMPAKSFLHASSTYSRTPSSKVRRSGDHDAFGKAFHVEEGVCIVPTLTTQGSKALISRAGSRL
jgi:hypothetical protein